MPRVKCADYNARARIHGRLGCARPALIRAFVLIRVGHRYNGATANTYELRREKKKSHKSAHMEKTSEAL